MSTFPVLAGYLLSIEERLAAARRITPARVNTANPPLWALLRVYDIQKQLRAIAERLVGPNAELAPERVAVTDLGAAALARNPAEPSRYEVQECTSIGGGFRITDISTDSRIATSYCRENATKIVAALNATEGAR